MPVSFRFFLVFAFAFRCVFFFFYLSFNLFGSDPPMSSSLKYPPPCYPPHKHTIKKCNFFARKWQTGQTEMAMVTFILLVISIFFLFFFL